MVGDCLSGLVDEEHGHFGSCFCDGMGLVASLGIGLGVGGSLGGRLLVWGRGGRARGGFF